MTTPSGAGSLLIVTFPKYTTGGFTGRAAGCVGTGVVVAVAAGPSVGVGPGAKPSTASKVNGFSNCEVFPLKISVSLAWISYSRIWKVMVSTMY